MGKPRLTLRAIRRNRLRDLFFIGLSIYVAVALEQTGALDRWIDSAADFAVLGSFIAGVFFTSLFTTVPAIVALAELSLHSHILAVAVPAALGALLGDLILYTFVRDVISEDFKALFAGKGGKSIRRVFAHPYLHWFMPLIGALVIASPLPDELGIALLGFSRTKLIYVIPISLVMNFFGVVVIGLTARAL